MSVRDEYDRLVRSLAKAIGIPESRVRAKCVAGTPPGQRPLIEARRMWAKLLRTTPRAMVNATRKDGSSANIPYDVMLAEATQIRKAARRIHLGKERSAK